MYYTKILKNQKEKNRSEATNVYQLMNTQNVVHPGNWVQFSTEKEQTTESCCDIIDELQKNYAKWNKLKTKGLK